jgi:hypothetical protein
MAKEKKDREGRKRRSSIKYVILAIILLGAGLLAMVSIHNYRTYRFRQYEDNLTLWKGKFAPGKSERVDSFEPLQLEDPDLGDLTSKRFAGKDAAYQGLVSHLIEQVDKELAKGKKVSQDKINRLLDRADAIVENAIAKGGNLAATRYQLAKKRVALTETALKNAYQKALPLYEEALKLGLDDAATLRAKMKAMRQTLGISLAEQPEKPAGKNAPPSQSRP